MSIPNGVKSHDVSVRVIKLHTVSANFIFLSESFTFGPFWNFWNTGKKNQSSRSKTYVEQMIGSGGIPTNSKSKISSADSNLGPRCEGSGKTKDLHTLGPRFEVRNETRNPPC
ncbi:hypothetical protein AVEN_222167-1 [Araneus ventricosus]|uniref:Uncharacterized protein n=1 Tax=Araneus ventricosus TaxID=182803 RepID=A0A4Y2FPM7_ARAVE|nr:hypothetical protein AVEN_222167-1 [Araneus ventricosus]